MSKQVIVMRTDLNMRKGKMVAQGAHASLKVFFDRISPCRMLGREKRGAGVLAYGWSIENQAELDWVTGADGFTKICLGVDSEEELLRVYEEAKKARLLCVLITDAGKTEFDGVPTKTCCAIGPDENTKIDLITGHLAPHPLRLL